MTINESSLNRVIEHMDNYDIACITAYRNRFVHQTSKTNDDRVKTNKNQYDEEGIYHYTTKEKVSRNRELKAYLLKLGYGVTNINGNYIEDYGTINAKELGEKSFFVVNIKNGPNFYKNLFEISEYYNQDCFLYKPKGSDIAYNIGTNNCSYPGYGVKDNIGKLQLNIDNEFLSRVGNKSFSFTNKSDVKHNNKEYNFHTRKVDRKLDAYESYERGSRMSINSLYEHIVNNLKELNNKMINETSRRQKAQQAIQGKNRRVKTIGIISAQNPMGKTASKEYNKEAQEKLVGNLKIGRFMYFVTDGLYGSPEKSVMVYNISLDDLLHLASKYKQESVIYVDIMDENSISYQYWEIEPNSGNYVKQHEESELVDATNDDDYYTKISKHFKFRIPFFEHINYINNVLNERNAKIDVDRLINESLDSSYTGGHKYKCRGDLYYKRNVNLNKQDFKNITENIIKRLVNEGYFNNEDMDEEMSAFEEYEKDYPNSDFKPQNIDINELIDFCQNYGDYLYIINGFRGWSVSTANSEEIQKEILSDLYKCSYVQATHEKDYLLYRREDWFEGVYVAVMKVVGVPGQEDYYIIYMKDK